MSEFRPSRRQVLGWGALATAAVGTGGFGLTDLPTAAADSRRARTTSSTWDRRWSSSR